MLLYDAVTVLGPFRVELELLALLLGSGNRDEVGADPPAFDDLVRDAIIGELEVPWRLGKRRIQDGILNNYLIHGTESLEPGSSKLEGEPRRNSKGNILRWRWLRNQGIRVRSHESVQALVTGHRVTLRRWLRVAPWT